MWFYNLYVLSCVHIFILICLGPYGLAPGYGEYLPPDAVESMFGLRPDRPVQYGSVRPGFGYQVRYILTLFRFTFLMNPICFQVQALQFDQLRAQFTQWIYIFEVVLKIHWIVLTFLDTIYLPWI